MDLYDFKYMGKSLLIHVSSNLFFNEIMTENTISRISWHQGHIHTIYRRCWNPSIQKWQFYKWEDDNWPRWSLLIDLYLTQEKPVKYYQMNAAPQQFQKKSTQSCKCKNLMLRKFIALSCQCVYTQRISINLMTSTSYRKIS